MKLLIVESPAKAKTISKYLNGEYTVVASVGHIRDLPKSNKQAIDIEGGFIPHYEISKGKEKVVSEIKSLSKKASEILLATDPDREGEAIAWHLAEALGLKRADRIVFHEITKPAIAEALKHPREIDGRLVDAQQARRVLDRLVGYKLSPFLWKKVASHLSAGRVQSVAVRLIADRENEIRAFKAEKYWTIALLFSEFTAELFKIGGKPLPEPGIKEPERVEEIVKDLRSASYAVTEVQDKEVRRNPLPPFTTSTLQQEASRRLRFSAKQTMRVAQGLYERGLITYMRTDSVNLSHESLEMARAWIHAELGEAYLLPAPRAFKTKSRLAQEAHEAVRPTNLSFDPAKAGLEPREQKLYDLIRRRFIASQLPPARFAHRTIVITASGQSEAYLARAQGKTMLFDGYLKLWSQHILEQELPALKEGTALPLPEVHPDEHETEPPPRYNEASLIKTLEEFGIGRPSTYAPTISVIQERNYVEKDDGRRFRPTEIGEVVNKVLTEHFPQIVDIGFTAEMEEELDRVAEGGVSWQAVMRAFYVPFAENLEKKYVEVKKTAVFGKPKETDVVCDLCGKPMVVKTSRFGKFLACTGFPACRNTKPYLDESNTFGACPKCGEGLVIRRRTKRGRMFYGCSRYPKCDYASWKKPVTASEGETGTAQ